MAGRSGPGQRVCLAVGSRGIDRIAEVTAGDRRDRPRARARRCSSSRRWAATAARPPTGQLAVLASLGITEASIGCEIRASMETVQIGEVEDGMPVFFDRHALDEADAVVPSTG